MRVPIRIVKRDGVSKKKLLLIYAIAVVTALVICGIILFCLTKSNPIALYKTMAKGAWGTRRKLWITIRETMILLGVALALTPAFKMHFWNIGGEGQILVGGIATVAVMIYLGEAVPGWVLMLTMVIASMVAGMIWSIGPAICKAKWKTNETLFTLMLNYVAIQLTSFFTIVWERTKGSGSIGVVNSKTKAGWLRTDLFAKTLGKPNYLPSVVLILLLSIVIFIYIKYTKHGYENGVVGESENTAKYVGINVKRVIIRTVALSGALCGLMGFLIVSGSSHTITTATANNRGFTAIIVTWLAKFNPIVMFLISLFLVFMDKGASQIATEFNLNESASEVITGIILFVVLASGFFTEYRVLLRKKGEE